MDRRRALKAFAKTVGGVAVFNVIGCGKEPSSTLAAYLPLLDQIKAWSYYVPLTSYDGILEEIDGQHELDRKAIYAELGRRTSRINGSRSDGTDNRTNVTSADIEDAGDYLRVKFWHDDTYPGGTSGHTLYLFARYLDDLRAGNKVYVATGMTQGHFHIVMLELSA